MESINIIIVGDIGVGKTSYVDKLVNKVYNKDIQHSLCSTVNTLNINGKIINIVSRTNDFNKDVIEFTKIADAVIIMISVDDRKPLNTLDKWTDLLQNNDNFGRISLDTKIIPVCNKVDNNINKDYIPDCFETISVKDDSYEKLLEPIYKII